MEAPRPQLEVHGPNGQHFVVELDHERVTIGRLRDVNSVALEPDPQQLITRQVHCLLERVGGAWFLVDNGSVNGTFLRRAAAMDRIKGRVELADGDVVCLLGQLSEAGEARYWELHYTDPFETRRADLSALPRAACLAYDWPQAKLAVVEGTDRHPIQLRAQAHKLVRYMADRNAANGGVPVLCTHDELMRAVWEDEPLHSREELARLVWELRGKLERYGAGDLVENERGLGYRLHTCL